ncbi:MAG: DUF1329 domain-containing protein [Pseudomonadota bacterium]
MKIRFMRFLKRTGLPLLSLLVLLLGIGGTLQAADLPKLIDKSNCAQYKDLLIPAMYRAVERGGWVITPGKINFDYKLSKSFLEASPKNEGKFGINPNGNLIEKNSNKIVTRNFYGLPFHKIDLKDPMAGDKIMWNFIFAQNRMMGTIQRYSYEWVNKSGQERNAFSVWYNVFMYGRPPGQEIRNPNNVLFYELTNITAPMSLKGTNTLATIYMDDRPDANYAYVPAIRRMRKTGSTSRSDPYMGSDGWMDLNNGWAGKNSSMKWKCIGEKTILVGFTSPDMIPVEDMPDGSITIKYPYSGHFKLNYTIPGWKGDAWAPAPGTITYVPRKVWVVEQMAKDPYYSWGLHIGYVDQETYGIWYKEVYDRSGKFRTWKPIFRHYSESPSGKNNIGSQYDVSFNIDEVIHHASVSGTMPYSEAGLYLPASKLDPEFFTTTNFLQLSK